MGASSASLRQPLRFGSTWPLSSPALSLALDDRSSHDSLRDRRAAGSDPGTDGVSGGHAPVQLGPLAGAETDGSDGRATGVVTLSEERCVLEQGRSPVEEAGHEEEGAEDEELGSTVEEGEEAAVALGALSAAWDLPWLPVKAAGSGEGLQPGQGGNGQPEGPGAAEATGTGALDAHCT